MILPFIRIPTVYHLGTLDAGNKGSNYSQSYEGSCLSVSVCPNAWEEIARLGGSACFELTRKDALFLDVLAMDEETRSTISQWAIEEGLAERAERWRLKEWDSEFEDWRTMTFASAQDAADEAEMASEATIETVQQVVLTDRGAGIAGGRAGDEAFDAICIAYLELVASPAEPDLVGIWWHEDLAPHKLSAPRGGVLQDRVAQFDARRIDAADIDDEMLVASIPPAQAVSIECLNSGAERSTGGP